MKMYTKRHGGRKLVKCVRHSERQQGRMFCRRWLRGEGE